MEKRKYTAPATTVITASVEAALLAGSNTYTSDDIIEVSPGTIPGGNAQGAASKLKINDGWE